jgi:ATP-dependent DNA helicase 2 subunit 2
LNWQITHGSAIDALIVAIDSQDKYLSTKKTWTRKIVLLTDGENPMEMEEWERTVQKMNQHQVSLVIVWVYITV